MKLEFRKIAGILAALLLIMSYQKEGFGETIYSGWQEVYTAFPSGYSPDGIKNVKFQIDPKTLPQNDLRILRNLPPFPIVFWYGPGGDQSVYTGPFLIMGLPKTDETKEDLPQSLKDTLREKGIKLDDVPIYLALTNLPYFDKPISEVREYTFNYFNHPWSHDQLIGNLIHHVDIGVFNPVGIQTGEGSMLPAQKVAAFEQNFHDGDNFSPNNAHFKLKLRMGVHWHGGWFLSIIGKKAIICYYLILDDMDFTPEGERNKGKAAAVLKDITESGVRENMSALDIINSFQRMYVDNRDGGGGSGSGSS